MNLDEDNPSPESSALRNDLIEYIPEHRNVGGLPALLEISPRHRAARRPRPANDPNPPNEYQPSPSRQRLHREYPAEPTIDPQYMPSTMNYIVQPNCNQQAPPQYAHANIDHERHGRLAAALIPYEPAPALERPPSLYTAPSSTARQRVLLIPVDQMIELIEKAYRDFAPENVLQSGGRPDLQAVVPPVSNSVIRDMEQAYIAERQATERITRGQNREHIGVHVREPSAQQNVSGDGAPVEIVEGVVVPPMAGKVYEQPLNLTRGAVVCEREQASSISRDPLLRSILNGASAPVDLARVAVDTTNSTSVYFSFEWHIERPSLEHRIIRVTRHYPLYLVWDLRIKRESRKCVQLEVKLEHCYPSNLIASAAFVVVVKESGDNLTVLKFMHPMYKCLPDQRQALLKGIMQENEPLDFDIMRVAINVEHRKDPSNEVIVNQSLERMLNNRKTDVKLVVRGRKFKAHKSLLSERSPRFSRLLEENPSQNVFHFDENPDSFSDLITYLYRRTITFRNNPAEMRALAIKYEVYQLVPLCDEYIYRLTHDYLFSEVNQPQPP